MNKVELHKAIGEAMKASNISEAKRMFAELYYEIHPPRIAKLNWMRVEAGYYRSTNDGEVYEIKEVPETKESRYYWNIICGGSVIGNSEILSTSKEIAEEDLNKS
jgi:hypothetical protein